MKNIVLIGFMATGKSTVGRRLAQCLRRTFVDTDKEIEAVTGKTIAQIFAKDGEKRFRSEENLIVKKLVSREGLVIATGGGLVLNPGNFRLLGENGIIIALTAPPDIIFQRVKGKKQRPLLTKGDLRENINRLLQERQGIYQKADLIVDTGTHTLDETVGQITTFINKRLSP